MPRLLWVSSILWAWIPEKWVDFLEEVITPWSHKSSIVIVNYISMMSRHLRKFQELWIPTGKMQSDCVEYLQK